MLDGKVGLITGAGSGIGRQIALLMAQRRAKLLITDIDQEGLDETLLMIRNNGQDAISCLHDVRDEQAWIQAVQLVHSAYGRLDILVNNAGIGSGQLVVDMPLEAWNNQIAINLTGVFLGCKHCIPLMRLGERGGSIINISSVAGLQGSAGLAGYCATKGGVRLFTKAVAKEYAADGIRCNSVHPGIIDTPIWTKIDEGGLVGAREALGVAEGANSLPADLIAKVATPLQRAGHPEEIAKGVVFLASDESAFMTGSELVIDGGMTA